MTEKFLSLRNLRFLLYEVFRVQDLTERPYYEEHSRETFDLVLETALKMGRDILRPALKEMDAQASQLVSGRVEVHPVVRTFMQECGQGGWIGAGAPFEMEGQQLPLTITTTCNFIFSAANYSASVYPMLTAGAAHLIESFGSSELQEAYIPAMFSGRWQGTMAMTEPQAGSSLADIITSAEPTDEDHYLLRGQKIFISAGDHDGVDNVVHLMLAKIKGAPMGVKGISLFVVPKLRPGPDGRLEDNDVTVTGLYHKLGYRGTPATQLNLGERGDCRGYLVGEPHRGLMYMFQMMNEARLEVGLGATAIASAAYYASLAYARERLQGRPVTAKDPATPQVAIIEHPDVRLMLLFQRAVVEGALGLDLQCAQYADLAATSDGAEKERCQLLLDLLTPVAKTYPSEMGLLSVSQGLQILGGYGYCDEFPLELFFRDARIHPIHEGTTGIQALDLLGRKVVMKNGAAFFQYLEELKKTIRSAAPDPVLKPYAHRLEKAMELLAKVTEHLTGLALKGQIDLFLADATVYLELFGQVTVAWQWLNQGMAIQKGLMSELSAGEANFYQGKLKALKFFFHYELPKIEGLGQRLLEADGLTIEAGPAFYED